MFEITAALIGCALGGASDLDFAAIWYREVMEGEIAEAANAYERLYLFSAPFDGPGREVRERAAYRAGLCFERSGELGRARGAYEWIVREAGGPEVVSGGGEANAARSLAVTALRRLEKLAADTGSPVTSIEVAVRDAMSTFVDTQRRRVRRLSEHAGRLRALVARRVRTQQLTDELLARFRSDGHPLAFAVDEVLVESSREDLLEELLVAGSEQDLGMPAAVALGFLERGLGSCLGGDLAAAWRDLQLHALLVPDERIDTLRPQFRALTRAKVSPEDLRRTGERLLLDTLFAERLRLRVEIEAMMRAAERFVERGRADSAIVDLAKVCDALEWSLPVVREDRELVELQGRALRELLRHGREAIPERIIADLWSERQRLAEEVISLAGRAVELAYDQARARIPVRSEDPAGARDHALRECRDHLSDARAQSAEGRVASAEAALERARLVLGWFPDVDRRGGLSAELKAVEEVLRTSATEPSETR